MLTRRRTFFFVRAPLAATAAAILIYLLYGALPRAEAQGSALSAGDLKRLSLEELMSLEIISVSKEPEAYGRAPAAVDVITGDEIRRSGASSLPEALRLADNLVVARKNAHDWAISARGFNTDLANKLLVLIDGRTVYTPLFSGVFWDRQDYLLEDIERIEVISGPGGTLWGANAVNGVINIITRSAASTQGFYAEAMGGNSLSESAGLRYGGSLGANASYRVYGKYFRRDGEFLATGAEAPDGWRMGQGGFRIDGSRGSDSYTVQGDYYDGRENIATGGAADTLGWNVLARWSRATAGSSGFVLQIYYDRTSLTDPIPALVLNSLVLAPAGTLKDRLDTYDADFQHHFSVGARNRLAWGLGYRFTHDVTANAPALAFVPPLLDRHLLSAFIQDEFQVRPDVALIAGTKIEHNDYTGFEIEPSVRLRWDAAQGHMVWAAVSRAIRAPARVDRHERLPTPLLAPLLIDNILVGGAAFKSENVVAYEGGYRGQWAGRLAMSLSLFYNDYDNIRSTSPSSPDPIFGLPFPLFFENNIEGQTHGVELAVEHQVRSHWSVRGSYRFIGEHLRVKPGKVDFNDTLNETADPSHQVSIRPSVDLWAGLQVDADLRWVGSFRFNDSGLPGTVPDYTELDARIGWQATRQLELSIVGRSLLHRRHLEYVISDPNPTGEIGRALHFKAAVRW